MENSSIKNIQALLTPEDSAIVTERILESIRNSETETANALLVREKLIAETIVEESRIKKLQTLVYLTLSMACEYLHKSERTFSKIIKGTPLGSNLSDKGKQAQHAAPLFLREELDQLVMDSKWVIGNNSK